MENDISAKVMQAILDHNEIQQYLHPELENRHPVRIVTNNLISADITIKKFEEPVLFLPETPAEPNLEIVTFKNSGDSIEFFIRYKVEGVSVSGKASIKGNEVSFTVFDIVEN